MNYENDNFRSCVFGCEWFRVEEHVWIDAGPTQLTVEQSHMAICDPDIQEGIPKPGGLDKSHYKACLL